VTKIFEGIQGRYNTDAILADSKVGIGYPMPMVVDGNVSIELVLHWQHTACPTIKLYWEIG
jgi:hypothetical protein